MHVPECMDSKGGPLIESPLTPNVHNHGERFWTTDKLPSAMAYGNDGPSSHCRKPNKQWACYRQTNPAASSEGHGNVEWVKRHPESPSCSRRFAKVANLRESSKGSCISKKLIGNVFACLAASRDPAGLPLTSARFLQNDTISFCRIAVTLQTQFISDCCITFPRS